jgi:hypothetical protein
MYCKKGKSKPINKNLYNSIKKKVKARSKVWPSAYASGQLVREYKSKGGKYKCARKNAHGCSFGSLDRWFKEEWVDLCKPKKNGKYQKCGRSKSQRKGYPYCRPLKRINSKTPRTAGSLSPSKIKKMCRSKQKNPYRRIFINSFGEKNNTNSYNESSMEKLGTCGFGRRSHFGNNLGATNSNFDTFYQYGTANSSHLTPKIRDCESVVYGDSILRSNYRFGQNKLKKINNDIKYLMS